MARRAVLAVAIALFALVFTASPGLAQTPKRGGTLRIAEREAPSLDPHLSISFLTHSHINMVYSQLVRFPHGPEQKSTTDFTIVPDLAERWEYKSPTVIVFTLRKSVKFHNKHPVHERVVTADELQ